MNLGDPELEFIDPTPDVHSLFVHFDSLFFFGKLACRATVRWSKRMYSCAGICSYEFRGGLCDIALSEPLLKLRPRKDLIETLLHEMIHALLFVTDRDQNRDGHGPNFQAHMHRINKSAGLNISIYHTFHDEVELYQTHWWRCDGPCQRLRPHFGIVRRSMNKAPGPKDYWWEKHKWNCGGKFIKIKEPQKQQKPTGKNTTTKPKADITKYISNNGSVKPVLKDSGNITANTKTNSNSAGVYTINKKGVITAPKPPPKPIQVFSGTGYTLNTGKKKFCADVTVAVKNTWANKEIPTINNPTKQVESSHKRIKTQDVGILKSHVNSVGPSNSLKHKTKATDSQPTPKKARTIDDYFNSTTILKDLYGDDYKLKQSDTGNKLIAVKVKMVDCPVCSGKFNNEEINRHLDECLNKVIIDKLSKEGVESVHETQPGYRETVINTANTSELKEIIGEIPSIPAFKPKTISEGNGKNHVTGKETDRTISIKSLPPENLEAITPVPEFKPFPSLPENIDNGIIDLTSIDFNTSNINIVSKDKSRRKTESEATLSSRNVIKKEALAVPGSSKDEDSDRSCPICEKTFDKSIEEHLDECQGFLKKCTDDCSFVVIDDENDILDESLTLNATGTKSVCPCCMKLVEQDDMNNHLDVCLVNS